MLDSAAMTGLPSGERPTLPEGHRVRRPRPDEFDEVVALITAADVALLGETDIDPSELRALWALPRFSLERDAWVVEDAGGALVAHAWAFNDEPEGPPVGFFALAPGHEDAAVGRHLLRLMEEHAGDFAEAVKWGDPAFGVWRPEKDELKGALYEEAGFTQVRVFEQMRIAAADVREAAIPLGIELRPLRRPADERAVHAAVEEAFADHFRYSPIPFEEFWVHVDVERPDWTIAWDADEVAGAAMGYSMPHYGYVALLAVRRTWRGRGLGLALLLDVMGRLRERGHEEIALGVDATNTTGAERLYRRAGMHVGRRTFYYEKPFG
jgi:mycothiol synthase